MNAHRFNMYAGAVIGSLLFFLLLNFFSDLVYIGPGHHDEPLAFAVAVEESAGEAQEAETVDYAALVSAANASEGEKIFGKCKSCHQVEDGANGVGPHLWGVVGRDIASAEGYSYSDALTGIEGEWTLENLSHFIESPKDFAPGTKMTFAGLKKPEDRVNLIVWLNEADGSPVELTAAETAKAEPAATQTDASGSASGSEGAAAGSTETAAASTETAPSTESSQSTEAAASGGGGAYADLLAAADAAAGEKVFNKCKACHTLEEGKHRVGPSLWGVVGHDIASAEGFNYSDAMKEQPGEWTLSELDAFLADPKGHVPGTKMSFPGVKDAQDRIDVITYINEADGSPEPLGE